MTIDAGIHGAEEHFGSTNIEITIITTTAVISVSIMIRRATARE